MLPHGNIILHPYNYGGGIMNTAKTAEQRAIEDAEWIAKKVAYAKGLKSPNEAQSLFAQIAQIEPARRTPKQDRQLAAYIKAEKLSDRAAEARAKMHRMAANKPEKSSNKTKDNNVKILWGVVMIAMRAEAQGMVDLSLKRADAIFKRDSDRALLGLPPLPKVESESKDETKGESVPAST